MLLKICIYSIHKEKNVFGNVFQIVYFGVRNIVCWVCVFFFFFFKKADNSTAQTRGRVVAKMPHCTDVWERRC